MGMPQTTHDWTAERVRALPDDGRRYECVDGELLVTPAPAWSHQRAIRVLTRLLCDYLRGRDAEVIFAPADIVLDPRTLVEPDLFVVPLVEGRYAESWEDVGRLLLAVEVLSPSSARADRVVKRRRYQRARFPEYWVVDVDARLVERSRPDDERPELLTESLSWQPDPGRPPLMIGLPAYFAEVIGAP